MSAVVPPLGRREKLSYGLGDFASVLYWQTFSVYLTYFYTDVYGLAAGATATMLGLSRSADAFFDPVMGMVADRTQSRWGKFRPYLLWLSAPLALVGILTFTTPSLPLSGKVLWAWLTYNTVMLLYTAVNIPYTALLGVMTADPVDRTRLSSIKFIGAFTAGTLVSALMLPGIRAYGAGREQQAWQAAAMVIAVLAVAGFTVTFLSVRERIHPPKGQSSSAWRDLQDILTNRPWLFLLGTTVATVLCSALRASVTIHYFKYFVGTQHVSLPAWLPGLGGSRAWTMETMVSVFGTSGQLAGVVGVFLVPAVARRFGRKATFIALMGTSLACTGAFAFLRPGDTAAMLALNLVGSFAGGPVSALLWTMYADAADFGEWKNGRRATGLVFSASIFATKQGYAVGAAISLALLSHVGFVANSAQPPEVLDGLRLLMSLYPGAFGLIAIALIALYPLNEARMAAIAHDLETRRRLAA
jgi:glycoside/pentoside/hexuronide:cation symporter, GPH family